MERQLDRAARRPAAAASRQRGIEVSAQPARPGDRGRRRVEGVRLTDGRMLPADLVVMAVGIRPERGAGASGRRRLQPRHRRRRRSRDVRSRASTPSANAPSTAASATAWSSPAYEQASVLAAPARRRRRRGLRRLACLRPTSRFGRRRVLGRRIRRRGRRRADSSPRRRAARLRKLLLQRRPARRCRAVRRYADGALVPRADPHRHAMSRRCATA